MTDNLFSILAAAGQGATIALLVLAGIAVALFLWTVLKKESAASVGVALLLLRLPLGLFLVMVSLGKVQGEIHNGLGTFAAQNAGAVPAWVPHVAGSWYLHAVPWVELIVGCCLILGLLGRFFGLIAALMIISFTIAVTGIKPDAGPFTSNLLLIAMAITVMLLGPGKLSIDKLLPARKKKK